MNLEVTRRSNLAASVAQVSCQRNREGVCAVTAGVTAAVCVNPLDVLKTRIQVLDRTGHGIAETTVALVKAEGRPPS